ncbi:MAG: DUF5106 domain-containing protein [Muribaculaceae bacterium]|nr:DUF5106 domain-containing protein [Muribaculaceae bacterium]
MKRFFQVMTLLWLTFTAVCAQDAPVAPSTPFAYPQAPDTCSTLESRCNYIISHFWDNYDITRPIADDAAFETAFRDFVDFFRFGHRNIVMSTIRDFLFKAQSNNANLLKVGQVAERVLYGPNAEYWSDEVYLAIARFMADASRLKKSEREYYKDQVARIERNQTGAVVDFEFTDATGSKTRLSALPAVHTVVFFGDNGADTSIDRLRLSTDVKVNALIESGQLNVVHVLVDKPAEGWPAAAQSLPKNWVNGYNDRIDDVFDVRFVPSCMVVDPERKILNKNVRVETIKQAFE